MLTSTELTDAAKEIIEKLMLISKPTQSDLQRLNARTAAEHRLTYVLSNAELIAQLNADQKRKLLPLLRRKTTRTISGVTVIAVMTKPYPCPQPEPCAYCPGGPAQGVPQSYTGHEPAAMRGKQNEYDPFLQVQ